MPPALLLAVFLCFAISAAAQTPLTSLAARNPRNPNILNSYGIELANAGDLMGAISVWRRALDFDRRNVHLYNNIGSALKRLGQDEHAFAWYAAALQLQPVYWTYYNIAILYRDHNQLEEASWALGEALRLNPAFNQATEMLARLRKAAATQPQAPAQSEIKRPADMLVEQPLPKPEKAQERLRVASPAKPARPTVTTRPPHARETPLVVPDAAGGQVFLTFDGGATDAGFDSIISSLRKTGVHCTFFLTGKFARQYPARCRELLADGHEIANHSMNHPDMKNFDAGKIATEIEAAEEAFQQIFGRRGAPFFRFPFGHQNHRVESIVEDLGYRPVYWHIDTIDWREDPVETIISRVKNKLNRNSVILMHLGSKNGARALDRILEYIMARGYRPARLSDLDAAQLVSLP